MNDSSGPATDGRIASGLLSEEEVQELLAPLDVGDDDALCPMLVLTNHPGDAERVIMHLMRHDVPVAPTEKWSDVLALLEKRQHVGFVATAEALGPDPAHSVEQLRAFHPELELCVVVESGNELQSTAATVVVRSQLEHGLDRFLEQLGKREELRLPVVEHATVPPAASVAELARPQPVIEPLPVAAVSSGSRSVDRRASGPDPLLAVQALLEAKAAGEDLVAGLRRWAERDPAILGVAECHLDETEWRLRATTPIAGERHRMLLLLLDCLGSPLELPEAPATAGPFSLFPLFRSPRSCVALWHQDAAAGSELLLRLRPLLPLIEALPEKGEDETAAEVRARFISLMESRMRAMDRGDGHLGILLVEAPEGESPVLLCRDLKSALRGGDWIEVVGARLYVILDHPGKGTLAAIGARLRGLPASERLRVVALAWNPTQGRAEALVGKAERMLEQGQVAVLGAAPSE